MQTIISYLTFTGDCRKAMQFYQKCLGGELNFQTIGESPLCEKMPLKMKRCILHAALINENIVLMGSDMVSQKRLLKGNAVSLMLNCDSERKAKSFYKKLSQGGKQTQPLDDTFWGALFGGLIDKYGNHWLLNFTKSINN